MKQRTRATLAYIAVADKLLVLDKYKFKDKYCQKVTLPRNIATVTTFSLAYVDFPY